MFITSEIIETKIPYVIWWILWATWKTILLPSWVFFLFWWFLFNHRASKTLLHQLFPFTFLCLGKSHFISFLNFVFISHAIRHQCKRHVLFPKGELFVFFNFCIFIASSVSFFMNEIDFTILRNKKIWRNWCMTYWSNAYVVEWNRKIFLRLKNKASYKWLKLLVGFFSN